MDTIEPAVGTGDSGEELWRSRGACRRRNYTLEEKRRVVAEAERPGASLAAVAQRHGINANMLFTWRREARAGRLQGVKADAAGAVTLLPLGVVGGAAAAGLPRSAGRPADAIEIVLPNGARVRVDAAVEAGGLRRILAALKEAW